MKDVLGNPYVRVVVGAAISSWLAPKIINQYIYGSAGVTIDTLTANGANTAGSDGSVPSAIANKLPSESPSDGIRDVAAMGIAPMITVLVFVGLGMITGAKTSVPKPAVTAAA